MTLESAPFYWLSCDAEGCSARCPEETDESVAWAEPGQAREVAMDSEWKRAVDGKDYCWDHALFVCEQCGKLDPTEFPGERDYLCTEHAGVIA